MINFVRKVENEIPCLEGISYSVGLVPPGYYAKEDGCYDYYGCTGIVGPGAISSKERFDKKIETLEISFETKKDWIIDNAPLLSSLYTTPGGSLTSDKFIQLFLLMS